MGEKGTRVTPRLPLRPKPMRLLMLASGPGPVKSMDAIFTALGDPTRRRVLERLSRGGTVTPSGLAARLPISRQAVSKHLGALEEAELVSADRVGRETHYRLRTQPLNEAARWIQTVSAEWDDRLEALRRTLARGPARSGL